jgi:hypothetical protein
MSVPLTPEFVAENSSRPLLHVAILLMVLQTIFVALFLVSRNINKTASGVDFWFLIPLGYIFCMGNCTIAIGTPSTSKSIGEALT